MRSLRLVPADNADKRRKINISENLGNLREMYFIEKNHE